jgi:drug/metabolite transporter (DMT)-like permease
MLIKVALVDMAPAAIVFVRTLLGALVLVPLAIGRHALRPVARVKWTVAVAAIVQIAVPFALITIGEQHISSSLAGVMVSSGPMFTALLSLRLDPAERVRGWGLFGVIVGLAGVVLLFGAELSGNAMELVGGLLVLLASVGYAAGALLIRRRCAGVPALGIAATTMTLAAIALLPVVAISAPLDTPRLESTVAMFVLGAGGTGVAFLIVYTLIAEVGAVRASLATYIAPGFAVFYGAILLHEPLSPAIAGGLALILVGSLLGAEGRLPWREKLLSRPH